MVVTIKSSAIKRILARKNMSQNCLAMRLEISSGYMSQLLTGTRNPSPTLRDKMLKTLKMVEDDFDKIFALKNRAD